MAQKIEKALEDAWWLLGEAADSIHASLAEEGISEHRRDYRRGLESRIRSVVVELEKFCRDSPAADERRGLEHAAWVVEKHAKVRGYPDESDDDALRVLRHLLRRYSDGGGI